MTRELKHPLPKTWWLRKTPYLVFMLRELTSLAVLAYAILLITMLWAAGDASRFDALIDFLEGTPSVLIHAALFILAIFHAFSWIALTPKVMVLWRGDDQVEPDVIAGVNGILFLAVTGALLWLVLT